MMENASQKKFTKKRFSGQVSALVEHFFDVGVTKSQR